MDGGLGGQVRILCRDFGPKLYRCVVKRHCSAPVFGGKTATAKSGRALVEKAVPSGLRAAGRGRSTNLLG